MIYKNSHYRQKHSFGEILKKVDANWTFVIDSVCLLKGHWTSSPTFSRKSWDFYTIRSVGMGNDCMLSFTFLDWFTFVEIWIFLAFFIFQSRLQ